MNMQFTYETMLTHQGTEYLAEVDINVTDVTVVPPDPMCKDSLDDFYGYKEMEFEVVCIKVFDEDGVCIKEILDKEDAKGWTIPDYDAMEAWLWEQLEYMGDDDGY